MHVHIIVINKFALKVTATLTYFQSTLTFFTIYYMYIATCRSFPYTGYMLLYVVYFNIYFYGCDGTIRECMHVGSFQSLLILAGNYVEACSSFHS